MEDQMTDTSPDQATVPALSTVDATVTFMTDLAATAGETVAVFWDRGWGDSELGITVHTYDGTFLDGQKVLATMTEDVYSELVRTGRLGDNWLSTYKARKVRDFIPEAATATP
jgi:hypothetical protein